MYILQVATIFNIKLLALAVSQKLKFQNLFFLKSHGGTDTNMLQFTNCQLLYGRQCVMFEEFLTTLILTIIFEILLIIFTYSYSITILYYYIILLYYYYYNTYNYSQILQDFRLLSTYFYVFEILINVLRYHLNLISNYHGKLYELNSFQ